MLNIVLTLCLVGLPAAFTLLFTGRLSRAIPITKTHVFRVFAAGALGGIVALLLERFIFGWASLSRSSLEVGQRRALLTTFLFAAPLEEAVKVLAVWSLYLRGRLRHPWAGLGFGLFSAAGFSASEAALSLPAASDPWNVALRLPLALAGHLFFAGLWGSALSERGLGRGAWFGWVWILAVVLHGAFQHLVHGAGLAELSAALPVATLAIGAGWWVLRTPPSASLDASPDSVPPSRRPGFAASARALAQRAPEPTGDSPALRIMRRALRRSRRKLLLHWIAIGALVVVGMVIALLVVAVYVGHRIGIDFALADEAGIRSTPPLLMLSAAVLAAFPLGGFLVARASGTDSVIEPAMASALALALLTGLLSMTAPVVFVFALAVSPLAFLLACGGAWFGLERE